MSLVRLALAAALLFAAGTSLLVTGCADQLAWPIVDRMIASDFPGADPISTDSLAQRLDGTSRKPRPVLLDVREPEEYAVSHLAGAYRLAPSARPDSALPAPLRGRSRNVPIVVYCSVGYRSAQMAERLEAAGFTAVSNLDGSIFRWANEGRPVYRGGQAVRAVHPYDSRWGHLLDDELHPQ